MSILTDTQRIVLSAAARRGDGAILPLPKALKLNKGAASSVLKSLLKHGHVTERPAAQDDAAWRETKTGDRLTLAITDIGRQAIGAEPSQGTDKRPASNKSAKKRSSRAKEAAPGDKAKGNASSPATRQGTKQSLLIDLLNRKEGATIAEAVKATGWQAHSVRGAISGALKKRLSLAVWSETVEGRGRVYRIATGG